MRRQRIILRGTWTFWRCFSRSRLRTTTVSLRNIPTESLPIRCERASVGSGPCQSKLFPDQWNPLRLLLHCSDSVYCQSFWTWSWAADSCEVSFLDCSCLHLCFFLFVSFSLLELTCVLKTTGKKLLQFFSLSLCSVSSFSCFSFVRLKEKKLLSYCAAPAAEEILLITVNTTQ